MNLLFAVILFECVCEKSEEDFSPDVGGSLRVDLGGTRHRLQKSRIALVTNHEWHNVEQRLRNTVVCTS